MLQLNDAVEPGSPGAAILHPADTEEGVEVAFTPPEAAPNLGRGASAACCPPLQKLTPFHVHNPTIQAKVKDYFVFRVSFLLKRCRPRVAKQPGLCGDDPSQVPSSRL